MQRQMKFHLITMDVPTKDGKERTWTKLRCLVNSIGNEKDILDALASANPLYTEQIYGMLWYLQREGEPIPVYSSEVVWLVSN